MITLTLPWPPGVNNLFATYRNRRIPTRRYKAWQEAAAASLAQQPWEPLADRQRIALILTPPDRRERDADGYLKAPIDFLVKAGVLAGDSAKHVQGVSAEWSDAQPAKPGSVTVTLEAA